MIDERRNRYVGLKVGFLLALVGGAVLLWFAIGIHHSEGTAPSWAEMPVRVPEELKILDVSNIKWEVEGNRNLSTLRIEADVTETSVDDLLSRWDQAGNGTATTRLDTGELIYLSFDRPQQRVRLQVDYYRRDPS